MDLSKSVKNVVCLLLAPFHAHFILLISLPANKSPQTNSWTVTYQLSSLRCQANIHPTHLPSVEAASIWYLHPSHVPLLR